MLNSIILLGGLVSAFGLGAINPIQEKQDNVQFRLENHKSVLYDDEEYKITLGADEVNNYIFSNLYAYFNGLTNRNDFVSTTISYNGKTLVLETFAQYQNAYYSYYYQGSSTDVYLPLNLAGVYDSEYFNTNTNYTRNFVSDIVWNLNSTVYADIKQAIELDIQANQPNNDYSPILGDIVTLLVSGITSFAGGLGAGVSALVGDIFINNGSLSVFGYMVVIFAGISLAIGLSRWIMNFLTSLGAKK